MIKGLSVSLFLLACEVCAISLLVEGSYWSWGWLR